MTKQLTNYSLYLLIAALLVLLDQLSKAWIVQNLDLHGMIPVWPFFSIVHAHNYGAAFGFLNHAGGWQTLFFAAVAIGVSAVLLVWLKRTAETERQLSIALAMVLGGAIGNLIDRLRFDYVIDFILVHYQAWYFPAFNVADSAITIGAILLIMESMGWKLIKDGQVADG